MKNNNLMFGRGVLTDPLEHPVENQTIIDEEENGYGLQLCNRHVTEVEDEEVLKRIISMSIVEIIN